MLKWLNENKEWLFSGVGIVAIGGVTAIARKFFFKKKPKKRHSKETGPPIFHFNKTIQKKENQDKISTKPLPIEIIEDVDGAPPYQQRERGKHYSGIKVKWLSFFDTIYKSQYNQNGETRVTLVANKTLRYPRIDCIIDIEEYPELKTIHQGAKIIISGKIDNVSYHDIFLINVKLKIVHEN